MHAFVAAILLRMARLDALNANAEAKPPDGSLLRLNKEWGEAKGTPLSLRMYVRQAGQWRVVWFHASEAAQP